MNFLDKIQRGRVLNTIDPNVANDLAETAHGLEILIRRWSGSVHTSDRLCAKELARLLGYDK